MRIYSVTLIQVVLPTKHPTFLEFIQPYVHSLTRME